jgi:hypothetical protein
MLPVEYLSLLISGIFGKKERKSIGYNITTEVFVKVLFSFTGGIGNTVLLPVDDLPHKRESKRTA